MKKILILIITIFSITACSLNDASKPVIDYLNKFKNHAPEVSSALNELLTLESITTEQKELYELIMKKQYTDLEYKIENITYNGNKAQIEILITVYDYINSKKLSHEKILANQEEYKTLESQMNCQLQFMQKENKRIKYTLQFTTIKENNTWKLITPNTEILQKIHGIYDYDIEQ